MRLSPHHTGRGYLTQFATKASSFPKTTKALVVNSVGLADVVRPAKEVGEIFLEIWGPDWPSNEELEWLFCVRNVQEYRRMEGRLGTQQRHHV